MSNKPEDGRSLQKELPGEVRAEAKGIAGSRNYEFVGSFLSLPNEKVIRGHDDNANIVLGRDRVDEDYSGKGGIGHTYASSIDIVAGRVNNLKYKKNKDQIEKGVWLNPDFENDSARIHISQKTDIDKNFFLPSGAHGTAEVGSGIGMKADNIRIMAREAIKLISSISNVNTANLRIPGSGVELIAIEPGLTLEDYTSSAEDIENPVMQPIPKGENLKLALEEILELLNQLSGLFIEYVTMQTDLNHYFASHTHLETFYGNQGIPSIDLASPLCINNLEIMDHILGGVDSFLRNNLNIVKNKYITPGSEKYINSSYHFLN